MRDARQIEALAALAREQEHARHWYAEAREAASAVYGDGADTFLALLAATSPRLTVARNVSAARACFEARACVAPAMSTHAPNVARALRGEELSGPKVRAFLANLRGDESQVTVDVWMLRAFGRPTENPRPRDLSAAQAGVEYIARLLGWTPAGTQAALWFAVRGDKGANGNWFGQTLLESLS